MPFLEDEFWRKTPGLGVPPLPRGCRFMALRLRDALEMGKRRLLACTGGAAAREKCSLREMSQSSHELRAREAGARPCLSRALSIPNHSHLSDLSKRLHSGCLQLLGASNL